MQQPSKMHSAQRAPGAEHIPLFPKGFVAIRIVQLVLAVIIIGLTAYGAAVSTLTGDYLTLFAGIATLIVTVYYLVSEFGPKVAYNYWAVLALDIFLVVFWIAAFALLAAQVAPYGSGVVECDDFGDCATYSLAGDLLIAFACLATAAGLGGVEFVLFVVSLAIHAVMMHRHRSAGLHCNPSAAGVAPVLAHANALDQPEKAYAHASVAPVYPPQQAPSPAPVYAPHAMPAAAAYPQTTASPHHPQMYAPPPQQQQQAPPAQYYQQPTVSPQHSGVYQPPQPAAFHHPQ